MQTLIAVQPMRGKSFDFYQQVVPTNIGLNINNFGLTAN
jgi:hypothetical protein